MRRNTVRVEERCPPSASRGDGYRLLVVIRGS